MNVFLLYSATIQLERNAIRTRNPKKRKFKKIVMDGNQLKIFRVLQSVKFICTCEVKIFDVNLCIFFLVYEIHEVAHGWRINHNLVKEMIDERFYFDFEELNNGVNYRL